MFLSFFLFVLLSLFCLCLPFHSCVFFRPVLRFLLSFRLVFSVVRSFFRFRTFVLFVRFFISFCLFPSFFLCFYISFFLSVYLSLSLFLSFFLSFMIHFFLSVVLSSCLLVFFLSIFLTFVLCIFLVFFPPRVKSKNTAIKTNKYGEIMPDPDHEVQATLESGAFNERILAGVIELLLLQKIPVLVVLSVKALKLYSPRHSEAHSHKWCLKLRFAPFHCKGAYTDAQTWISAYLPF